MESVQFELSNLYAFRGHRDKVPDSWLRYTTIYELERFGELSNETGQFDNRAETEPWETHSFKQPSSAHVHNVCMTSSYLRRYYFSPFGKWIY